MRLFEVDVQQLLPRGDPRTVPLVQFMAAANDAITAGVLYTSVDDGNGSPAERCLAAATGNYFFRLACGHLYEGLAAFRQAVREGSLTGLLPHMEREGQEAYEVLLEAADPANQASFFYRILRRMRIETVFHYNREDFERGMGDQPEPFTQSFLVLGPVLGQSRFVIADDLAARLTAEIIGQPCSQQAREAVQTVAQLQGSVSRFMHHLLVVLHNRHPDAIRETEEWPNDGCN